MKQPDFIRDGVIDFHLPGEDCLTTLHTKSRWNLYTQLVCWCLVQRFWYYVLHDSKVSDTLYDQVEAYVAHLEKELGPPINRYSPTKEVGSTSMWMYPISVLRLFGKV